MSVSITSATEPTENEFVYANRDNCTKIAKFLHPYIHGQPSIVLRCFAILSKMDRILYSSETRAAIQTCLTDPSDEDVRTKLASPEATREHLYRFCAKGSNCIQVLLYYLKKTYTLPDLEHIIFNIYESDWDTTILINPTLTERQFMCIFDTLVSIIEPALIDLSRFFSLDLLELVADIGFSLSLAWRCINMAEDYAAFRQYPITYKHTKQFKLKIHDNRSRRADTKDYVDRLGLAGPGVFVSSNRTGGIRPAEEGTTTPKFFLGRLMLSVVASRNIWLPVELFDISMNYQNDDLRFSWESYSEYHIVLPSHSADFRILSPVSLYADLVKCIYDADRSNNATRKNKVAARIARIQRILDEMVIPYGSSNATIRRNIERHRESPTLVGTIVRRMNTTRRAPRDASSRTSANYYTEPDTPLPADERT